MLKPLLFPIAVATTICASHFSTVDAGSCAQRKIDEHMPVGDMTCFDVPEELPELKLTLGSSIHRVLTLNRALAEQRDSACKARLDVGIERSKFEFQLEPSVELGYVAGGTAGSGPSIAGAVDFTRKFTTGTSIEVKPEANRAAKGYWWANIVTEIRQPLLRGYGRLYNLDGLQRKAFDLRTSMRNLFKKRVDVVVETVTLHYEIVKQHSEIELLEKSLEMLNGFYHAARVKQRLGIHDAIGVYRAELEMRKVEDALSEAYKRLGDAEDKLRDLLVLPMHSELKVEVPLTPEEVAVEVEEAVQIALSNRVELDQARDYVWETCRRSKVKRLELLPELDLVMNYSRCGQNQIFTKACWGNNESEFGIGLTASTKVNHHKECLELDKSLVDVHTARVKYSQEVDTISVDVHRRLRSLERFSQRIEITRSAMETAERDLNLAGAKYERNFTNNKDLIDAERNWRGARSAYITALIDRIVGEYELLKSLGILLEKPCI